MHMLIYMHACFGETTLSGVAFRHLNGTHAACKTVKEGSVARLCSMIGVRAGSTYVQAKLQRETQQVLFGFYECS